MLTINNFERNIDNKIIIRGFDYYKSGAVSGLDIYNGKVHAEVFGSRKYIVKMSIDEQFNIYKSSCNCPYDMGIYCKHEVAVMYELRDHIENGMDDFKKEPELKQLLTKQAKDELVDVICEAANKDSGLKKILMLRFATFSDSIDDCVEMINRYIDLVRVDDYVNFGDVDQALKGVYIVIDKALKFKESDPFRAAEILIATMDVVTSVEVLFTDDVGYDYYEEIMGYDSEGDCPEEILQAIDSINEALGELALYDSDNAVFELLMNVVDGDPYSCFYDACENFCGKKGNREVVEKIIDKMEDENYRLNYRYRLIRLFDGEEKRKDFIEAHIDNIAFREIAIHEAMQADEYERVIYLVETAVESGIISWRVLNRWKQYALKASEMIDDISRQKKYLVEFIKKDELEYLDKLKRICDNDEWKQKLGDVLSYLKNENRYSYKSVLIKENMIDDLFEMCKERPADILELHKYFTNKHTEEAKSLFKAEAIKEASGLSSRAQYQGLCAKISKFGECYSKEDMMKIINILRVDHKRQRAFIDELNKIAL